jgi:hypothetical protein
VWAVDTDVCRSVEAYEVIEQIESGVVEVRVVIGISEVRVERDADQAAVAGGCRGQLGEGLR